MENVYVSINFIKTLKESRNNHWNENLTDSDIFKKIRERLIYDELVNDNDKLIFNKIKSGFQGVYIVNQNKVIYFTQMLNMAGKTKSRNTFLMQNFLPAWNFSKKESAEISISLNPFDDVSFDIKIPDSIENNILSLAIVLDKEFLNKSLIFFKNKFEIKYPHYKKITLDEYLELKTNLKLKNTGNNSTYIELLTTDDKVVVYGKLNGANRTDTIVTCLVINKLNINSFELVFLELGNENILNKVTTSEKIIQNNNFRIIIPTEEYEWSKSQLQLLKEDKTETVSVNKILKRNRLIFIRNIINTYSQTDWFELKQCFACDYMINDNLIAAHIHRYSDIIRDYKEGLIDIDLTQKLITSGENGFLLCPNQDREFEKGMILFNIQNKSFEINFQMNNDEQREFISKRILNRDLGIIDYTKEFESNVKKHLNRINYKTKIIVKG